MTDRRLRELTYKLIQMAPEAPPFPEDPMTLLKPRPATQPEGPSRRPVALWAAAAVVVLALIGVPIFLLGGGDDDVANPSTTTSTPTTTVVPTTTSPPTTVPVAEQLMTLYFLGDVVTSAPVPGPRLAAVSRIVRSGPAPTDQVEAALAALLTGPSGGDLDLVRGVVSAIPTGTALIDVGSNGDGIVTIDLSAEFASGGGSFAMRSRLAQIVYTATQFPGIDGVLFELDGEPVSVFSSEGVVLEGPQTRADFTDVLPAIFVETPLPGATVTWPLVVSGVANTFEATLEYRLETADGVLVADGFTTATCGTGCWGTFDLSVDYGLETTQDGFVVLFESSAEDGRAINVVRIPVVIEAAEGSTEGMYIEVYSEDIPGGAPVNGAFVVTPTVALTGETNAATTVVVDGTEAPVVDGTFEATVRLAPGTNEIVIEAGRLTGVYTLTYWPGGSVEFAYLTRVSGAEIEADYAQWLTGDAAVTAAIEDGFIRDGETLPNDYYIRNQNPQLRTLPVLRDVLVSLPTPAYGSVLNVYVPRDEWIGLFKPGGTAWDVEAGDRPPDPVEPHFGYFGAGYVGASYWLTLDAEGVVVQITGQYRP